MPTDVTIKKKSMIKKKTILLLLLTICLSGCFDKKTEKHAAFNGEYPVIDIGSIAGKYQRAYCSDYFSSIELIPLETNDNCLIGIRKLENIVLVKDSFLFVISEIHTGNVIYSWMPRNLFVFDRSGNFLNQIGGIGQGPGEFTGIQYVYFNSEKPTIFVDAAQFIFEYDFTGNFINSFHKPYIDGFRSIQGYYPTNYVKDNLFIGTIGYSNISSNNYFLFDRNGEIVKSFPDRFFLNFYDPNKRWVNTIRPFRKDDNLYIKDKGINDTIYIIENFELLPVCVFDLGKFAYPLGEINEEGQKIIIDIDVINAYAKHFSLEEIIGMSNYFFYKFLSPSSLPAPKLIPEPDYSKNTNRLIYGIYDIEKNTNILLDTDHHHQQKGFINDINGGLSIIPRFYAGNDEVVDIWWAEDMKEMLTDEYFASLKIKDQVAHQKLKELLKNLQEDDNPVIVIAKLK